MGKKLEFNLLFLLLETMAVTADDYVADSEDEASKNFKGRVCMLQTLLVVFFFT